MDFFDDVTKVTPSGDGGFEAEIPSGWGQGRAAYGGISGALVLRAAEFAVPRPVRSLSLNFVGPLVSGKAAVTTRILREGRSATHLASEIVQDGVSAAAILVLGDPRETLLDFAGPVAPKLVKPEDAPEMPYMEGFSPEFTRHFEYRWTSDSFPFSGGEPHVQGWIRAREGLTSGPAAIAGLLDAWPPPIWSMLDTPAPGSSVSWFVSFAPPAYRQDLARDAWWIFDSHLTTSNDGYAHFEGNLWNEDGQHVAISRQVFAEFSRKP